MNLGVGMCRAFETDHEEATHQPSSPENSAMTHRQLEQLLRMTLGSLPQRSTAHAAHCPSCLRVSVEPQARWRAARALVRPSEVRDLFHSVPNFLLPPDYSVAGTVAQWLRGSFARGSLRYRPDPPGTDIWCSPAATRRAGGGDCDDLAILGASMIAYAGAAPQVAIGYHCDGRSCSGHAWVEGHDGQGWFLLEGTSGQLYRFFRPQGYALKQLIQPATMP